MSHDQQNIDTQHTLHTTILDTTNTASSATTSSSTSSSSAFDQNPAPNTLPIGMSSSEIRIKDMMSKRWDTIESTLTSKQEQHTNSKTKLQLQLEEIQKQLRLEEEQESKAVIQIQSQIVETFYESLEVLVPKMQKYPYLLELFHLFSTYILSLSNKQDAIKEKQQLDAFVKLLSTQVYNSTSNSTSIKTSDSSRSTQLSSSIPTMHDNKSDQHPRAAKASNNSSSSLQRNITSNKQVHHKTNSSDDVAAMDLFSLAEAVTSSSRPSPYLKTHNITTTNIFQVTVRLADGTIKEKPPSSSYYYSKLYTCDMIMTIDTSKSLSENIDNLLQQQTEQNKLFQGPPPARQVSQLSFHLYRDPVSSKGQLKEIKHVNDIITKHKDGDVYLLSLDMTNDKNTVLFIYRDDLDSLDSFQYAYIDHPNPAPISIQPIHDMIKKVFGMTNDISYHKFDDTVVAAGSAKSIARVITNSQRTGPRSHKKNQDKSGITTSNIIDIDAPKRLFVDTGDSKSPSSRTHDDNDSSNFSNPDIKHNELNDSSTKKRKNHELSKTTPQKTSSSSSSLPVARKRARPNTTVTDNGDQKQQQEMVNSTNDANQSSTSSSSSDKHTINVIVPSAVRDIFLKAAQHNTEVKNIETIGRLWGQYSSLENSNDNDIRQSNNIIVKLLEIPPQKGTADTCKETISSQLPTYMDDQLIHIGNIHTHPTHKCFMSSQDIITQCNFQILHPHSFSIVMAPTDTKTPYNIYNVTDKAISMFKKYNDIPEDDNGDHFKKLYRIASHVQWNDSLEIEIKDNRNQVVHDLTDEKEEKSDGEVDQADDMTDDDYDPAKEY